MTREQLILKAKELVNTTNIKGMTAITLKNAANTDLKLFEEYLREISEQAWDPNSRTETINAYGKELVDISMKLFSKPTNYNNTRLDKMEKSGNKSWTNESTKRLIKTLLKENLKKNSAIELINDFGMFLSMNLSQVTRMGKDEAATKELNMMMKNIRGPIINGMNYFELTKDVNSIIRNPKMLSALLGKIREFLIYIEPRIQRFVIDNEFKPKWLEKIQRLKELYKNVIL